MNNIKNNEDDEDGYIDFSIDTIIINHVVAIISTVCAAISYKCIDNKSAYLGNEFMFVFCLIVALCNIRKIVKRYIMNKKSKDMIRVDYE